MAAILDMAVSWNHLRHGGHLGKTNKKWKITNAQEQKISALSPSFSKSVDDELDLKKKKNGLILSIQIDMQ